MSDGQRRQIGENKWRIAVSMGRGPDGKYREKSKVVTATTKRQLDAEVRKLHEEVEEIKAREARYTHGIGANMGDLLDKWMEHLVYKGRSPNTLSGYRWRLPLIKAAVGDVEVCDLRVSHLNNFYRALVAKGYAARTVRQFHAMLSAALTWAVKEGWVESNEANKADPPSIGRADVNPPTPAEVRRLIAAADAADDEQFAVALRLAVASGARRAELCALRWDDVSFTNSALIIRGSVVAEGGKVEVKTTKSGRFRSVPLSAEMLTAIEAHMRRTAEQITRLEVDVPDNPFLFSTHARHTSPITPDALSNRWEKVRAAAGVDCRLHDLRHFFATQLLAAGKDVVKVSYWLGHSSTKMTLDTYGHYVPDSGLGGDAASYMESLLAPAKEEAE